jgi:hypothetical protein
MRRAFLLALVIPLLAFPGAARADWIAAKGERMFPPEQPEAEACRLAEDKAKEDAVRQVTGERLSSEELMRCSEQGEQAECTHNSAIWSMVDGDVRAVRNRHASTSVVVGEVRKCSVELEADVVVPPGRPDPSFDLGVKLNGAVFRDGEPLEITLSPSQPMGVAVFQWLPYEKGEAQVTRVLPNAFDPISRIDHVTTIPSEAGKKRYVMRVGFPENLASGRPMVDEYLMVVATKKSMDFRESYSLDDFKARLLELPRGDVRMVRKAYTILRGNP